MCQCSHAHACMARGGYSLLLYNYNYIYGRVSAKMSPLLDIYNVIKFPYV